MLNANLSDVPDSKFQRAWSSQSDNYYIIGMSPPLQEKEKKL